MEKHITTHLGSWRKK